MKPLPIIFCLLLLVPSIKAVEITVGGIALSIPPPEGYAPVTREMKLYSQFAERFVPPTNTQHALFLPAMKAALAASGGIPRSPYNIYLQTAKELEGTFVTNADFELLKKRAAHDVEKSMGEAKRKATKLLSDAGTGKNIGDYQVDPNLALQDMSTLPVHHQDARSIAFSTLIKLQTTDEQGNPKMAEGAVTCTYLHVRGKLLYTYVNAEKENLEWTRAKAKQWTGQILAANPSSPEVALKESSGKSSMFTKIGGGDFDVSYKLGRIAGMALIGAIIAAVVFRKKKE